MSQATATAPTGTHLLKEIDHLLPEVQKWFANRRFGNQVFVWRGAASTYSIGTWSQMSMPVRAKFQKDFEAQIADADWLRTQIRLHIVTFPGRAAWTPAAMARAIVLRASFKVLEKIEL